MTNYANAKEALLKIVRQLEGINPSAARSLAEGLEETLTVHVAAQSVLDECHRVLLVDGAARGTERKALPGRKSGTSLDGDGVAGSGEEI